VEKEKRKNSDPIAPHPDRVFLLNPQNRQYLRGKKWSPAILGITNWGLLLLGVIPVCGVLALIVAFLNYQDYMTRHDEYQSIEGHVVGKRLDSGDSILYYLRYEFVLPKDILYKREDRVDEVFYNQYKLGDGINVLYDPADPNLSEIAGTNEAPIGAFCWGLICLIAWPFVGIGIRYVINQNKLMAQKGRLIYGQILDVTNTTGSWFTIRYRFVSPQTGQTITRRVPKYRGNGEQHLLRRGAPVAILFRNDNHYILL
jgi:hypothetical protein